MPPPADRRCYMDTNNSNKIFFDCLEKLRQSGEANMFGATLYLQREFPELRRSEAANAVLLAWLRSFEEDYT